MKERIYFCNRNFLLLFLLFISVISLFYYNFFLKDDNQNLKSFAKNWLKREQSGWISYKITLDENAILQPYMSDICLSKALDILPSFRDNVDCTILVNPQHFNYNDSLTKALNWRYSENDSIFWQRFQDSPDICKSLQETFAFFTKPLTQEEADYSLAYGMLVYKDIRQLTYMLSAFYQPQNAYCIAIDGNAHPDFQKRMKVFEQCFPNIHIFISQKVHYGGPEIPAVVLSCVQELNERKHPWKYFQYLSGVDLPLKTNLEMVRIFKALNGTFNAEVTELNKDRYANKTAPPLPLWKSSLSSTFSRASANVIATHPKVYELLQYLLNTTCPDESLWATIAGNPDYIKMPGGFSSKEIFSKIKSDRSSLNKVNISAQPITWPSNSFPIHSYYISRFQVWGGHNERGEQNTCAGTWSSGSCVYGIGDLPKLLIRPELVAHKLYLEKHPAAFFCLYEKIRERSLDYANQQNFDASTYKQLPQVQLSEGKSIDYVKFYF